MSVLAGFEGVLYKTVVILIVGDQLVDAGAERCVGRHHRQERSRHVLKLWHFVVDVR